MERGVRGLSTPSIWLRSLGSTHRSIWLSECLSTDCLTESEKTYLKEGVKQRFWVAQTEEGK